MSVCTKPWGRRRRGRGLILSSVFLRSFVLLLLLLLFTLLFVGLCLPVDLVLPFGIVLVDLSISFDCFGGRSILPLLLFYWI